MRSTASLRRLHHPSIHLPQASFATNTICGCAILRITLTPVLQSPVYSKQKAVRTFFPSPPLFPVAYPKYTCVSLLRFTTEQVGRSSFVTSNHNARVPSQGRQPPHPSHHMADHAILPRPSMRACVRTCLGHAMLYSMHVNENVQCAVRALGLSDSMADARDRTRR